MVDKHDEKKTEKNLPRNAQQKSDENRRTTKRRREDKAGKKLQDYTG